MKNVEFKAWPKIGRGNPFKATITEKIDGTNACVIVENGEVVGAQSRNRIITIKDDNYGFAAWVDSNKKELSDLGDGYHYGEWAGLGIQKNPHLLGRKYFFLFNSLRWEDERPSCCDVVPILMKGNIGHHTILKMLDVLESDGSTLGGKAEGIVIYHHASRSYTKHTIKMSDGKWMSE